MQIKKLFIVLSIIAAVSLVGLSAQCLGPSETPTIELEVYDGPDYSESDDMCYYRVEAVLTGSPEPEVEFSADDNVSLIGTNRVEVGVDIGDLYDLTATAENLAGAASATVTLEGQCGEEVAEEEEAEEEEEEEPEEPEPEEPEPEEPEPEEPEPEEPEPEEPEPEEPEPEVINLNVPKVTTEGGYIEQGGGINSGGGLFAGDSRAGGVYVGDRPVRGYVSFDITGLSGKTIDDATLTLNINSIYGSPGAAFGGIWVGVVEWEPEALVSSDFNLPQVGIQLFDMAGGGNITCDTATLKTQLQNAINDGKSRFQIRISCPGTISINNTWDGWSYLQAGVNLNIDYH